MNDAPLPRYERRATNLSKPETFELEGDRIARAPAGTTFDLGEANAVHATRRFDGFLFVTLRSPRGRLALTSASAQGFGKPILDQSTALAPFVEAALARVPATASLRVGSSGWYWFGWSVLGLCAIGLVVGVLVLVGGAATRGIPWGKFMLIPVLGVTGVACLRAGRARAVDRTAFLAYLAPR